MAGIEKLTNEINLEAEKEASEIIAAAEDAANKLRSETEKKCEAIKAEADEKTDKKIANEKKKTQSQCEQVEKLITLEAKQGIIDSILQKAKAKLLLQDSKDYFDTIYKLLGKQALADKGILFLNEKDLKRAPSDFAQQVNSVATKNGGMLTISEETADIDGGFILRYGNIEINSSFDALFEENQDNLIDTINGMLWT